MEMQYMLHDVYLSYYSSATDAKSIRGSRIASRLRPPDLKSDRTTQDCLGMQEITCLLHVLPVEVEAVSWLEMAVVEAVPFSTRPLEQQKGDFSVMLRAMQTERRMSDQGYCSM